MATTTFHGSLSIDQSVQQHGALSGARTEKKASLYLGQQV
jgi:hypothetical protein